MKLKVGFLSALVAGALVLCASTPARAIMLSVSGVNSSTTSGSGGSSSDRATAQSLSITNGGGSVGDSIGNTILAASRYISNAAADRGVAFSGGTANAGVSTDYTLTVFVSAPFSGEQWQVDIDTRLTGGLTALDDALGASSSGSASVSAVTGRYNGSIDAGLGLASSTSRGGTSSTSGTQTNVNFTSPIYSVFGTGSGSFTLRFTFSTSASSPQNAAGGDEQAARFGSSGPLGGASADDYPGPSGASRTQSNDGHFVNLKLTVNVVPEPSTFAMAGIGAVGLALAAWRRRRVR